MRKRLVWTVWFLAFLFVLAGCGIDSHLEQTAKTDDPLDSDDERDFTGMVTTFFALPHGESTLLSFPNGKKLLIDTGSGEDAETLLEHLEERRVTKLDYVLITNDQPEHAGGYPFLARSMQIDTVLMPELTEESIRRVVPLRPDVKLALLSEGDELALDENILLKVLHPSEFLFLSPQDNSLVFQLIQDQLRFLFTGGIGERAEERLLERHQEQLPSQVLKVADRGSNQATSQPFLSKVDPQVAIIPTGQTLDKLTENQEEVLERLRESWAETYLTGQHGTITILSNGKHYKVIKGEKS